MNRRIVLTLLFAAPFALAAGAWLWVKAAESRRLAQLERRVADLAREADRRRCPRPVLRGTALPGDAWDDYLPAIDLLQNMTGADTLQMRSHHADESHLPELRTLVQPYLPALDRMQQGTRRAESRRIRIHEKVKSFQEIEDGPLSGVPRLAVLSSCRARWLALEGKTRDAAELVLDLAKFAEDVAGDGSGTALVLGANIWGTALEALQALLATGRLSPQECAAIERDLAQLEATFPRFGPVLLARLEYFGTWILNGSNTDTLRGVGCIPAQMLFKPGWREAFSQPLMAAAGFDQTEDWTVRLLSAPEESFDEEDERWKKALEEWYPERNIYFRLFTNSEGMPKFRALREPRGRLRVLRMAAHYLATGEPLDVKLPGFGTTVEPKALYFWGPFVETVTIPR